VAVSCAPTGATDTSATLRIAASNRMRDDLRLYIEWVLPAA
jgi:hypothetical protein